MDWLIVGAAVVLLGVGGWVGNWVSVRVINSAYIGSAKAISSRSIEAGLGSNASPASTKELQLPDGTA